jgi:hypothetical protein
MSRQRGAPTPQEPTVEAPATSTCWRPDGENQWRGGNSTGRPRPTRKPGADADARRKHDNRSRSRVHGIHWRADNRTKECGIQVRTLSTEVDRRLPGRNWPVKTKQARGRRTRVRISEQEGPTCTRLKPPSGEVKTLPHKSNKEELA